MNSSIALLISVPGCLAIGASIWEWDWYFRLPMAAEKVQKVGKKKARIFYFWWGVVILILAVALGLTIRSGQSSGKSVYESNQAQSSA